MATLDPEYLDAIKGFEGYSPNASWDYKQYSSGYGTKAEPGEVIDQATAEQRYQAEITKAAAVVDSVNPNLPVGARAALTSLTYNAGPGWSQSGLGDLVRSGDLQGAQARLLEYNKAGGEVNPGLVARREKEAAWFGGGLSTVQPPTQPASLAAPANSPLQAIPPQAAPSFTPQQAAQAAPQQTSSSLYASIPVSQIEAPPPIFAPPRKPIDLSKLRAAFQAPPNRRVF